jgi:glycosidase
MRIPQQPAAWIPGWARSAIFYHIYPLGFFGAPRKNDHQGQPEPRLADLRRWVDHLAGLGVTALYFGPLFESGSHGYDTVDYFSIDRRLGDLALFREVLGELHGRGIRVILDGVFNHTGRGFFAFRDIQDKGRESRYAGWYHIDWAGDSPYGDGFAYRGWDGHAALPVLNHANPDVRSYLFEVARMWLADVGVDGWRLDVAYEIGPEFWWEFRRVCKAARPDCFLVGELIHGDLRKWAAPDLLDGATNYQLYKAIHSSLNGRNFWELGAVMDRAVHAEWGLYRDIGLLNFLGNHDVTRILSLLDNPAHVYPALIFLLTAPGIPCLYYGDEVGMRGRKQDGDAALRQPMPATREEWPDADGNLYRAVAALASIRRSHAALTYGRYATLSASATSFGFLRAHSREAAVIALNSGSAPDHLDCPVGKEGIPDGTLFRDVLNLGGGDSFTVRGGSLRIEDVYPGWGRVLVSGG